MWKVSGKLHFIPDCDRGPLMALLVQPYMNNHVHRAPFSDIERKKEVAKSKERRKGIHKFINY